MAATKRIAGVKGVPQRGSGTRLKRPLVLVVDDMPDNREMYMEYLESVGFRVVGARDGATAVRLARDLGPSIVLMDLSLPGMDGWEATRILKSDPTTMAIPVIAVSGHAEPAYRTRAFLVGCDRFVAKPSLPSEIAEIMVGILDEVAIDERPKR
jgi:CheY-like chemotaxis protein